jgi:crotonobetainyl-CoA:carnitine CoA-transferase CaiB-like acyl-CoA transferase
MPRPLEGVRILALSQFGAGPFGMLQLADLGAEIIKIEDPTTGGDVARYVPPYRSGQDSLYYHAFNRNNRGITLNLRVPEAREVLHDLVRISDGFFSNLRGDQPERLGLTYEHLGEVNPRIVCCSLSGFGMTGPRKSEPGYDYLFQAYSGFMSLTGDPSTPPTKAGVSIVDYAGGLNAALGLMIGIFQAQKSGKGCEVDVSLLDTAVSMLSYVATFSLNTEYEPKRLPESSHPTLYPSQVYAASDGYLVIMVAKEKFWPPLCIALERPDLIDDSRFRTFDDRYQNYQEMNAILKSVFKTRTVDEWMDRLRGSVPCAPVNSVEEALNDPQILAREMVIQTETEQFGPVKHVASAIRMTPGEPTPTEPGPALGADTDDVLSTLTGYGPDRIQQLRELGAI